MDKAAKISEFIDWAIAERQAISNIADRSVEDVYDAVKALKSLLLPPIYRVEVEKIYTKGASQFLLTGAILVSGTRSEGEAIAEVDRMIVGGLQTNDSRIEWNNFDSDGWSYEDFSLTTTGGADEF